MPREALIRSGGNERLIIAKGEGRYAQRKVIAGMESGEWIEILEGIEMGEKVVVSAQFLIDSEAGMKASFTRMSDTSTDESKPDNSITEPGVITGKGIVDSLMIDHGMITLQHEAIESLGWPAMTMDFITDEGTSLQGLATGDVVIFELVKKSDKYLISAIHKQGAK